MVINTYGCHLLKAQIVATIWSYIQYKYQPLDNETMNAIILLGFLLAGPLILTLYISDYYHEYGF